MIYPRCNLGFSSSYDTFSLICIIAALLLVFGVFKIQHKTVLRYPAQPLSPILFS